MEAGLAMNCGMICSVSLKPIIIIQDGNKWNNGHKNEQIIKRFNYTRKRGKTS